MSKKKEDLGIEVSTKYGGFLSHVLASMKEEKERSEFTVSLNTSIMPVIEKLIAEEKEKFK